MQSILGRAPEKDIAEYLLKKINVKQYVDLSMVTHFPWILNLKAACTFASNFLIAPMHSELKEEHFPIVLI